MRVSTTFVTVACMSLLAAASPATTFMKRQGVSDDVLAACPTCATLNDLASGTTAPDPATICTADFSTNAQTCLECGIAASPADFTEEAAADVEEGLVLLNQICAASPDYVPITVPDAPASGESSATGPTGAGNGSSTGTGAANTSRASDTTTAASSTSSTGAAYGLTIPSVASFLGAGAALFGLAL